MARRRNCRAGVSERSINLPPQIVSNILSRLPIDSILRCKSVCKSWYSLTQDSYFSFLHLIRSINGTPLVILQAKEKGTSSAGLYLLDTDRHKVRPIPDIPFSNLPIMCSMNGMLCLAPKRAIHPTVICNPITQEFIVLPESEVNFPVIGHQVGFGFDPLTKSYKVVRIYDYYNNNDGHEVTKSEIITVGDDSWRQIVSPYKVLYFGCQGPVVCNGKICWIINQKYYPSSRDYILFCDISREVFGVIRFPPPPSIRAPEYKPYLVCCNLQLQILAGNLALLEFDGKFLHLWRISGGNAGNVNYSCDSISLVLPLSVRCFRSLLLWKTPEILLLEMDGFKTGVCNKNNLVYYSRRYNRCAKLAIPGIPKSFRARTFNPSFLFCCDGF